MGKSLAQAPAPQHAHSPDFRGMLRRVILFVMTYVYTTDTFCLVGLKSFWEGEGVRLVDEASQTFSGIDKIVDPILNGCQP